MEFNRNLLTFPKDDITATEPLKERPLVWSDGKRLVKMFNHIGLKESIDPNAKFLTLDEINDIVVNSLNIVIERCQELVASDETIASIKKSIKNK